MAYNKKNYYRRIIEIQELTKEYQELGLTNTKIYEKYIKDQYFICKRTYDEYLGVPAKRNLKRLIDIENSQYNLFE